MLSIERTVRKMSTWQAVGMADPVNVEDNFQTVCLIFFLKKFNLILLKNVNYQKKKKKLRNNV